ncbi:calphotin-like isoform X2 [Arapaima gigas]
MVYEIKTKLWRAAENPPPTGPVTRDSRSEGTLNKRFCVSPRTVFPSATMAASFLRVGRLGSLKCVLVGARGPVCQAPTATFCVKAGDTQKPAKKTSISKWTSVSFSMYDF